MLKAVTTSKGMKRKTAGGLAVVSELLYQIPGTQELISIVDVIGSIFGISGIAHAGFSKTLISKDELASIASLFLVLATICEFHESLKPYAEPLRTIAALLGATVIGKQIKK